MNAATDFDRNNSQDLLEEATKEIFKNCDFKFDPSDNDASMVFDDLLQLETNSSSIANDHDYTKDSSSTSRPLSTSSSVSSSSGSLPNSPPLNNQPRPPMYSGTHNFGMGMEAYGNYLVQAIKCQACGTICPNQQIFTQHMKCCPANVFHYPPPFGNVYNFQQFGYPQQVVPVHQQIPPNNFPNMPMQTGFNQFNPNSQMKSSSIPITKSTNKSRGRKRKIEEKENLEPEILAKLKTKEWESRTGYWCQKCKIRFGTSNDLIDHMAKNVHQPATNGQR